jgi:hypothetical protein
MTKLKTIIVTFTLTASIMSCGNNKEPKTEVASFTTETPKLVNYPFNYVNTKKEARKLDDSYNEMILFTCGNKPSLDTLKMFCVDKKQEFTDGIFHIVVFFDNKENAIFPSNPITGGYMDEKPSKHIKAIYTYNKANGYSKLDYYEKNYWESSPQTTKID